MTRVCLLRIRQVVSLLHSHNPRFPPVSPWLIFKNLQAAGKSCIVSSNQSYFLSTARKIEMASKSALILLADGNEEMELVIPADVLTRAGVAVTVAGTDGQRTYKCSRNVKIVPDISLDDAKSKGPYDVVILPGGLNGAKAFAESAEVGKFLKDQESANRTIAAICASPTALLAHGVCLGKKVTCYPSLESEMMEGSRYVFSKDRVVVDGELITSQGPGTCFEFALQIVRQVVSANYVRCCWSGASNDFVGPNFLWGMEVVNSQHSVSIDGILGAMHTRVRHRQLTEPGSLPSWRSR